MKNLKNDDLWHIFTNNAYKSKICSNANAKEITKPLVSEYILNKGFRPVYPEGRQFAVLISHDVDLLNPPASFLVTSKKVVKNALDLYLNKSFSNISNYLFYKNPSNYKLDRLLSFLLKEDLRSTFFFLALNDRDLDYQYDLGEHKKIIRTLIQNDFEIGLHGNQNAYASYDEIIRQKNIFFFNTGINPAGYRNHLLNFDIYNTWHYLEKAGFLYDTTLGFTNKLGFRNGMAFPFNPYSEKSKRFLNILELPLNIMDVTLSKYLKYNYKDSCKEAKNVINTVIEQKGVVTLLLHHNHLKGKTKNIFNYLIKYIKDQGGWITTKQKLTSYWLEKQYNNKINDILIDIKNPIIREQF